MGVLEFNLFTCCRHDVRLASLIVPRALARASLECICFSRDGFLLNFRNADLRLLIAVLHSSLEGAVVEWLEQLGYGAESRRIA